MYDELYHRRFHVARELCVRNIRKYDAHSENASASENDAKTEHNAQNNAISEENDVRNENIQK